MVLFTRLSKNDQGKYKILQANNYYNLACIYSLNKQTKKAFEAFEKSINDWGYTNYSHAKTDTDLDNIRSNKQFIELMQSIRAKGDYLYILQQAGKYRLFQYRKSLS